MKKCGSEPLPYPPRTAPKSPSAPAPKNALPAKGNISRGAPSPYVLR